LASRTESAENTTLIEAAASGRDPFASTALSLLFGSTVHLSKITETKRVNKQVVITVCPPESFILRRLFQPSTRIRQNFQIYFICRKELFRPPSPASLAGSQTTGKR